jgi:type I restriction enzyme, S subunit
MSEQNQLPFLPSGWVWTTLGEVTESFVEQQAPDEGEKFLYIDISSVDNKAKWITNPKILPTTSAPSRARQRLKPFDVVVSMTRPNLNAVSIVPEAMEGAIGSTGFHVLRTRWISPFWIYFIVQTNDFVDAMSALVQGVLYPAVRPRDIDSYQIPLAPIAEQRHIVDEIEKQFSRLDAAVEMLQLVERNLERLRAATLKAAVEGRLVPTEAESARAEGRNYESAETLLQRILRERRAKWEADQLDKIKEQGRTPKDDKWKDKYPEPAIPSARDLPLPQGWTWATIDQLSEFVTKGSSPNWQGFEYTSEGIIFVRSQNVLWGKLDLSDKVFLPPAFNNKEKKSILKTNDVLLNIVGASIGRSALATKEAEGGNVNQAVAVIRLLEDGLLPALLVNTFISPNYQAIIHAKEVDVARANISLEDIKTMTLMLSPLTEQYRTIAEIERRISVIEELKTLVNNALRRAAVLRQKILREAFAGKLVAQDTADEPASILLERIRAEKAEREAETRQAREERRGKMKGSKAKRSTGKPRGLLRETLAESKRRLTPEQLFAEAGFTPQVVEDFYEELRREIKAGHIKQVRPDSAKVYLIAAANA